MTDLFEQIEFKAGVDEETIRTGAMIALRPRQDHIDRLAVVDGEKPEELHTTIIFLGKAADYGYDLRDRIVYAMREVAQAFRQVTGNGFSINVFNPSGEEPCIVLGVGGDEMVDIRNAILERLTGMDLLQVPKNHEPWVPHITLNYTDDFGKVEEYLDLTGEIVYDAIRVVFGGIVDDVMLQPAVSSDDGPANRYSVVPDWKTQRVPLAETKPAGVSSRAELLLKSKPMGKCYFCKEKATKRVGIDGGAYIATCKEHTDDADELIDAQGEHAANEVTRTRNIKSLELKTVRHVRTAGGVRRFGQPIGTVIVGDGSALKNLKEAESEYDGFNKYIGGGKTYYTHKNGGKFEALDKNDKVIASNASEEGLLRDLDSGKIGAGTTGSVAQRNDGSTTAMSQRERDMTERHAYPHIKKQKSDYEGYDKYKASDGTYYVDQENGDVYDENDNIVYWGTRKESLSWLNGDEEGSGSGDSKPASQAAGVPVGKPKGKDSADISDGETSKPDEPVDGKFNDKQRKAFETAIASAAAQLDDAETVTELAKLAANMDDGKTTPQEAIDEIHKIQQAAKKSATKYVLGSTLSRMKNAMKLYAEGKSWQAELYLRSFAALQSKLITPGGRVGSDRKLGSRSNGENWVERSKIGGGSLPKYIRIVRNGLMKAGHSEARATGLAVAAMKRWARGANNVRPAVQAAAAAALAQWEAMKAAA